MLNTALEAERRDGRPWSADWDEIVMRLLATGLVELDRRAAGGRPLRLPYPVALQRGFDRLTVMSLAAGVDPPASVAELISWCERPFGQWPFLPAADGAEEWVQLLVDGRPSPDCVEWRVAGDVEAEFREQKLIFDALEVCRQLGQPESYIAFRELLIRRPVMSELELLTELAKPELVCVAHLLQRAYGEPPPETVRDGVVRVCAHCGCALVPNVLGRLHCGQRDCAKALKVGRQLPVAQGARAVGREVLIWVTGPGRTELRIRDRLAKEAVAVTLWPEFDAADLQVVFADNVVWYADVKTWANPVQLARRLRLRPFRPPQDGNAAYLVIGKEQTAHKERRYMDSLTSRNPDLRKHGPTPAVTERAFLRSVLERARQVAGA